MNKYSSIEDWGGDAWHLLHTIGLNVKVNENNKKDFLIFLNNFQNILPCPKCRTNFNKKRSNFAINEKTITNKNYQKWIYNIHNMVNDSLYKNKISFDQHRELHKPFNTKKINRFTSLVIDQLNDTPSYQELLECKTYLTYLIKLYPKDLKNKNRILNKLNTAKTKIEIKEWYQKYVT